MKILLCWNASDVLVIIGICCWLCTLLFDWSTCSEEDETALLEESILFFIACRYYTPLGKTYTKGFTWWNKMNFRELCDWWRYCCWWSFCCGWCYWFDCSCELFVRCCWSCWYVGICCNGSIRFIPKIASWQWLIVAMFGCDWNSLFFHSYVHCVSLSEHHFVHPFVEL